MKKKLDKIALHYRDGTLFHVAGNILKRPFRRLRKRLFVVRRDWTNRIQYGRSAPLYMERIWVDPREVKSLVPREEIKRVTGMSREEASGYVINWEEIRETVPVLEQYRIQYCLKHWVDGISWKELGVYEFMSTTKKYGNDPKSRIVARFQMLDEAFEEAKQRGRLKTRQELDPLNFREQDGILIHIGRDGIPCFGGNGFHRLGIALALNLKKIPACIGVVDRQVIPDLNRYRDPPVEEAKRRSE